MSKFRFALLVTLAVTVVAIPAFANHSWGNYHWARQSNPFTLKVYDNVTSKWESHLQTSETDWNKSTVLDLAVQWQQPLSNVKRCASASGVIEICNARYGNTGWLGIAGISASGGHITKGYTKLNDTYFDTPTYNTPAWRNLVTCQELGHDFGLDHQDENFNNANLGTCMDYTNDPGTNQHPNQHDYQQIETIYAHLDGTTTIANVWDDMAAARARVPSMGELLAGADQWGAPVGFDGNGRPNKFVIHHRDENGEEHTQFTHVFWAPVDPFEGREGINDPLDFNP